MNALAQQVGGSKFGFWLFRNGAWVEVKKAEYMKAEREAGFIPQIAGEPATSAFGNPAMNLWGSTLRAMVDAPPKGWEAKQS